jgi:hypothetical protein
MEVKVRPDLQEVLVLQDQQGIQEQLDHKDQLAVLEQQV